MPTPRVAILSPDLQAPDDAHSWREPFAAYQARLAAVGIDVVAQPWRDGPHPDADVHLALLAWGYHLDETAWFSQLDAWPAHKPLLNAPALLRWNTRKTYLQALEQAGVAIVPTLFAERGDARTLAEARERFGADAELVLKPQTSAASHGTHRLAPGESAVLDAPAMIQPFMPAVGGEGELSVFLFDGEPAHAAAKVAAPGDFRVQPQFGGRFRAVQPPAEALALARAALAALPAAAAYARVDMVRDPSGVMRLMELEAIEPDLYLGLGGEAAGDAFTRMVTARL